VDDRDNPDIAFLAISGYDVELVATRSGGFGGSAVCSVATASTALMYAHEHIDV
jgi:hypothetical protein